jgi:hypothetical protein
MDDTLCQAFFSRPACPAQRQYEALRAVFLDHLPQNAVAARFGYSPDAFRQLVHRFRQDIAADSPPPFSSANDADGRPALPGRRPGSPTPPTSPMSASWT